MKLYDKICAFRLTAAVLYDRGVAAGQVHDDLEKALTPLKEQMREVLKDAAEKDLPGIVFAVKALENETTKIEMDIKFLQEKKKDTMEISKFVSGLSSTI